MSNIINAPIKQQLTDMYRQLKQSSKNLSGPFFISWDVTNKCNFMCQHCLNRSGDQGYHKFDEELNEAEADKVCDMIIQIMPFSMCICGGEPLLRKDIFKIIKRLSAAIPSVNMVTNGYLLNESIAQKLVESGLKFIQISLDSDKIEYQDSFRLKEGAYEHALNAIKLMAGYDVITASAFCPTKLNISSFEEYVDIIVASKCYYIRMMPLLPLGRGLDNYNKLKPTNEQYISLIFSIKKKMLEYSHLHLNIEWGDPLEHIYRAVYQGDITPLSMEIRSNGDVAPSIYLPISIGNVRNYSLKDYWDNGFNKIWSYPIVRDIAKKCCYVDDFSTLKIKTWTNDRLKFDLIDSKEEIENATY